jgi:DNA-binding NarL/FixJ family response regulator
MSAASPALRNKVFDSPASGTNNHAIAERLCISQHTVHRHVANILAKRNASS